MGPTGGCECEVALRPLAPNLSAPSPRSEESLARRRGETARTRRPTLPLSAGNRPPGRRRRSASCAAPARDAHETPTGPGTHCQHQDGGTTGRRCPVDALDPPPGRPAPAAHLGTRRVGQAPPVRQPLRARDTYCVVTAAAAPPSASSPEQAHTWGIERLWFARRAMWCCATPTWADDRRGPQRSALDQGEAGSIALGSLGPGQSPPAPTRCAEPLPDPLPIRQTGCIRGRCRPSNGCQGPSWTEVA